MKCDHCENEATVHEVTVKNGVKIEKHLCEVCAQQQGLAVQSQIPFAELMTKYIVTSGTQPPVARATHCPICKITFAEFRQHGLLGCAECYRAFEDQLAPLIERAHEGGTSHVGKVPRRASGGKPRKQPNGEQDEETLAQLEARAERLRSIREELDRAVAAEEYEKAARLRDEIRKLSSP